MDGEFLLQSAVHLKTIRMMGMLFNHWSMAGSGQHLLYHRSACFSVNFFLNEPKYIKGGISGKAASWQIEGNGLEFALNIIREQRPF